MTKQSNHRAIQQEPTTAHANPVTTGDQSGVSGGEHSMDLSLSVNDLSVSLKTQQSLSAETCALVGQVNLLRQNLAETVQKLEEANYKIGFLQAQLLMQQEQFRQTIRSRLYTGKAWRPKLLKRSVGKRSKNQTAVEIIQEP